MVGKAAFKWFVFGGHVIYDGWERCIPAYEIRTVLYAGDAVVIFWRVKRTLLFYLECRKFSTERGVVGNWFFVFASNQCLFCFSERVKENCIHKFHESHIPIWHNFKYFFLRQFNIIIIINLIIGQMKYSHNHLVTFLKGQNDVFMI